MEYRYMFHKFLTGHLREVSGQLQNIEKGPPATAYKAEGPKRQSGCFWRRENPHIPAKNQIPNHLVHSLVTTLCYSTSLLLK